MLIVIKMDLSELHDCKKCHGKIVNISIDHCGVTRCGYCNQVVDYYSWFKTTKAFDKYKGLTSVKNADNIQR